MKKDPDAGKRLKAKGEGAVEDEMVRYYHWTDGHEFKPVEIVKDRGVLAQPSPLAVAKNWTQLTD